VCVCDRVFDVFDPEVTSAASPLSPDGADPGVALLAGGGAQRVGLVLTRHHAAAGLRLTRLDLLSSGAIQLQTILHTRAHTHTHTHTRTHTHAHTRMHTHRHTRTRTHARRHTRTQTHTHTRAHTRTHTHTHTHTHVHTHAHAHTHAHTPLPCAYADGLVTPNV